MKIHNNTNIIISILAILLLLIPTSCEQKSNAETVWFRDPNGRFHTNDAQLAQREIPFTIVLPTYLPNVLGTNYQYQIYGPYENIYFTGIEVKIDYIEDDVRIYISEQNNFLVMQPTEELDPIYHDIVGIRVLQQRAQLAGSSGITEGLAFNWNQDGLTFSVEVFDISKDEGIKIVESMITQIK